MSEHCRALTKSGAPCGRKATHGPSAPIASISPTTPTTPTTPYYPYYPYYPNYPYYPYYPNYPHSLSYYPSYPYYPRNPIVLLAASILYFAGSQHNRDYHFQFQNRLKHRIYHLQLSTHSRSNEIIHQQPK